MKPQTGRYCAEGRMSWIDWEKIGFKQKAAVNSTTTP